MLQHVVPSGHSLRITILKHLSCFYIKLAQLYSRSEERLFWFHAGTGSVQPDLLSFFLCFPCHSLFTFFFPYLSTPPCSLPVLACFTKYFILSATKSTCCETELCFPVSLIVFRQLPTSKDACFFFLWLVMQVVDCAPVLSSLIAAFRGLGYDSAQYLSIACVHLGALLNFDMEYKPQMQAKGCGGESSGSCLQNMDG